ncbi:MAG: DUF86 domain-containing protein [Candidatus Pacebacteria bacterium]|jgi:uncharacterized protein with HEPN domain|nr:DUF86 domain-containing protein [Candidatus Paceibacterota bacterium]
MTKRSQRAFVRDIYDCIRKVDIYVGGMSKSEFRKNDAMQDATVRRIEIIGEAAKNIAADFKKEHKEIPWKDICGMRDILTHDYFGINFDKVWKTIKEDLPPLKDKIKAILKDMRD